ncbi:sn-glycerol-3-phosphate import ATP-binding protein UgpC [Arhodomonas aquaeolei]|uniref:sn-glycerol-3-phosphate import ATP-binding protein UgpC n=1 Tax=Arhodomonas aquaeolei TaxID=2369 RepID=UPI000381D358|nr:sn-glycerol-3-phosphate import ATP-binding protein UgpC [Arhodomonas aquaeolei]
MAELHLNGVRKVYAGGVEAIRGVDLEAEDGEFVVIVGPSGCGKSTLLRMVAGLERTSEGEIRIGERVVNDLEPAQRDIAMVFQNYALYPHMSVFRNMAYGLNNQGRPKEEILERVQRAARMLQLEGLLERKPRQLSGGQRQRVAMGRALVRDPKVFLFDEPLSNLDAKLRVQMRVEIKALQRGLGTTAMYVTHDQVEAMTLADRLVVMNGGVAEQIGRPLDIYQRPATRFVAGFIGSPSMNFLTAAVAADGRSLELPGELRVPLSARAGPTAGRQVTVGVRPEHLHLSPGSGPRLTLSVGLIELLGAETVVYGHPAGHEEAVTLRVQGVPEVTEGQDLELGLDPAHVHLFDARTGRSLSHPDDGGAV